MKRLIVALGASALIFAISDLIHGQHNGDAHRLYIHTAEFISFLGFLSLLQIRAFRLVTERYSLDRWLVVVFISIISFLAGFALFSVAGGSAHGDGGPLAVSFGLIGCLGMLGIPVGITGFVVATMMGRVPHS